MGKRIKMALCLLLVCPFIGLSTLPVGADQAAWISQDAAQRAAERIRGVETLRKFCAPCGDKNPTPKPVGRVEVRNPSGEFYEVVVDGEGLDLAYTYLPENGRWRNLALMLGLSVTGVPEFLAAAAGAELPALDPEADSVHPLDRELEACLTLDASTAGMVNCMNLASEKWDAELNRVYNKLRKSLRPAEREALQTAQRAWIAYRDAEFALLERIYDDAGGSLARVEAASRRVEFVRARVLTLAGYAPK